MTPLQHTKAFVDGNNKKDRLRWCLSMLDHRTLPNEPKFIEMHNIIHMDEKWFNTTSKYIKYYMLPEEEDPHRTVHNKNRIGKVMFLSAVGRPIYDDAGNCIFDGKLGVWPFVRKVQHITYTCFTFFHRFLCYKFVILTWFHLL